MDLNESQSSRLFAGKKVGNEKGKNLPAFLRILNDASKKPLIRLSSICQKSVNRRAPSLFTDVYFFYSSYF